MARHESQSTEPNRERGPGAHGGDGSPRHDARHPSGAGGPGHGGRHEFVVLTEAEEPPEELAGTGRVRAVTARRRWLRWGAVAGIAVVGFFVWTLPGSGALEAQGGATWCIGGIPANPESHTVEVYAAFKNYSSLPVTVTGAGAQQVDGLTIEKVEASVRTDAGGSGAARFGNFRSRAGASPVVPLGADPGLELAPGKELLVVLTATSPAQGDWSGQVADVRVDYHSWTLAPHRSVDSSVVAFTTGRCPE